LAADEQLGGDLPPQIELLVSRRLIRATPINPSRLEAAPRATQGVG
jgi:hypothetical protein